jgi:hypothetical protein
MGNIMSELFLRERNRENKQKNEMNISPGSQSSGKIRSNCQKMGINFYFFASFDLN